VTVLKLLPDRNPEASGLPNASSDLDFFGATAQPDTKTRLGLCPGSCKIGAQKTTHAFVIWREKDQFEIKYSGAIDDNGMHHKKVNQAYIQLAVNELLMGKEVTLKETNSIGCRIYFKK
jgi:hypothetical protein